MHVLVRHEAEGDARAAAGVLVEHGVGATVAEVPSADGDAPAGGGSGPWCVQVLEDDLPRACEVLGFEVPVPDEPERRRFPVWVVVLAIWAVAMVVIPLAAFWLTVTLAD